MKNMLLFVAALVVAPFSFAQIDTTSTQAIIQGMMRGSPGATVNGVGSGAVVTRGGQVLVPASGLKIPVPISVAGNVGKAGILRGALGCTNPIGAIVCIATAAAVIDALANRDVGVGRYRICPNGIAAFICKPDPSTLVTEASYYWSGVVPGAITFSMQADPAAACKKAGTHSGYPNATAVKVSDTRYNCYDGGQYLGSFANRESACKAGFQWNGFVCTYTGPAKPNVAASAADVEVGLQERMDLDFQENRRLYEALKADQLATQERGVVWPLTQNPVESTTPVTVTAPPVTTPERVVSTKTETLPDGTSQTTTRKEVTTVTPTTTGTTVADSKTSYSTSTVITTTVINNTTNVTNTTTETVADKVDEEPPPNDCAPNSPLAKCATLGDIPTKEVIPSIDVPVSYTSVLFASAAGCPADESINYGSFGGVKAIEYQPMCNWLGTVRPLFLALGALACAWIFMESLKS